MAGLIRVTSIFAISILIISLVSAQSRTRPRPPANPAPRETPTPPSIKRPVIVNLKQGAPIQGKFIRADGNTVQIEVQSGQLSIEFNNIVSLVFEDVPAAKPAEEVTAKTPATSQPGQVNESALRALRALRKLSTAAAVVLPYPQYAALVIETKGIVDEAIGPLPVGVIKDDLSRTMEAYVDAGQAWSQMQNVNALPLENEFAAALIKKYSIKPSVNAVGKEDRILRDVVLSTIWAQARTQLDRVSVVLGQ
jgi:hypothetical protein